MKEDFSDLANAISIAYPDLQKSLDGSKAAGLRLRKQMHIIKALAKSIITKSKAIQKK